MADGPSTADDTRVVDHGTIAIVGAGSIGAAFALLFGLAGREVRVYDRDAAMLAGVGERLRARLAALRAFGLTNANDELVLGRVSTCAELKDAVGDAVYIQECAPEVLDIKRRLFADIDGFAPPDAVIASASSAIPASEFAAGLPGEARCLVVHPGNPPYLLRVVELVPAAFTSEATLTRARVVVESAGLAPVLVRREVEGFVFNRLQGALLREAYCLVRDGVADVADIDRIVRDGLGLRWSVVGPFETVDLNTRGGIEAHAKRLGPAYERMGAERGQHDPWTAPLVARVVDQRRALMPLDQWEARVEWRDRALMSVLAARQRFEALEVARNSAGVDRADASDAGD